MKPRTPFVAGNWKMNTDRASAVRLAEAVHAGTLDVADKVRVAVCPPFVYLDAVGRALRSVTSPVALGAQDVYFERNGAYTGEVSTAMLLDLGVRLVIVGHSERRHILGESDELVRGKVRAVLDAGLECILCVGETLAQREAGRTDTVNESQVRSALTGLPADRLPRLTIAYEPVWAIGTGRTATPADAQDAQAKIRAVVASMFGRPAAERLVIQYGGSVKPENARALFAQPDIDGGLIGGASLDAEGFCEIVRSAAG